MLKLLLLFYLNWEFVLIIWTSKSMFYIKCLEFFLIMNPNTSNWLYCFIHTSNMIWSHYILVVCLHKCLTHENWNFLKDSPCLIHLCTFKPGQSTWHTAGTINFMCVFHEKVMEASCAYSLRKIWALWICCSRGE